MAEAHIAGPELPNLVTILAGALPPGPVVTHLVRMESAVFSVIVIAALVAVSRLATGNMRPVPGRLQCAVEAFVGGIDSFVCGILGRAGRRYTPFIGTLFIYILAMNLAGVVPLMKSPTASWSTTMALALCVFFHLQYTALRELGVRGYLDHLAGRPRGAVAFSVIIPVFMLFLHVITELMRPISLSLRLRSNIWGDDMILAVLAGFGLKGAALLTFNMMLTMLASTVQAAVFTLLTTIYFALALEHR